MNRLGFCLVLLVVGASSKTVVDPTTRVVDGKLGRDTSGTIGVDNSTVGKEDGDNFEELDNLFDDFVSPANKSQGTAEGRTFGVKRIQFMMMPMIYKMGVMMTLLVILTVISLKGLAIGVMLLVLKLSAIFGKFYASTQGPGGIHGWAPQPPQPVHVHLHNSGPAHHPSSVHHHAQPYSGWDAASGPPEDEHYYYKG